jgi:DNA-binding CsgD family transcriptional regulator
MHQGYQDLTEREKQTLRLMLRGHDAKSMARELDLSVHTINERLRYARRKLSVSSSREAARIVHEIEGAAPVSPGDTSLGDADRVPDRAFSADPERARITNPKFAWLTGATLLMSILIAVVALSSTSYLASDPPRTTPRPPQATELRPAAETEVVTSARNWLALVDAYDWDASWEATGTQFRDLNTRETWASLSTDVRPPFGAIESRTLMSQEEVPAPPRGYVIVKFRTSFADKPDTIETLSLEREDSQWKVVGYWIG